MDLAWMAWTEPSDEYAVRATPAPSVIVVVITAIQAEAFGREKSKVRIAPSKGVSRATRMAYSGVISIR